MPRPTRINVTLEEDDLADLEAWANEHGRPVAGLASFLIKKAIEFAKEKGDFPETNPVKLFKKEED
ncbi:hypothetical protein IQ268_28080 [Oculatella sp. LEGE 06141]|uniref:ribbon-helix-helix domain-containing protein n=1 Tax=Oculatella sp. LEGE 06141 TaxID=1828648 RepID=UPI001882A086|nr:hypothetical protein [Oculatella sp. LEGE 06141]MBE9182411.1 hypothetical protein [Oculatella sp. LEGE 06141]